MATKRARVDCAGRACRHPECDSCHPSGLGDGSRPAPGRGMSSGTYSQQQQQQPIMNGNGAQRYYHSQQHRAAPPPPSSSYHQAQQARPAAVGARPMAPRSASYGNRGGGSGPPPPTVTITVPSSTGTGAGIGIGIGTTTGAMPTAAEIGEPQIRSIVAGLGEADVRDLLSVIISTNPSVGPRMLLLNRYNARRREAARDTAADASTSAAIATTTTITPVNGNGNGNNRAGLAVVAARRPVPMPMNFEHYGKTIWHTLIGSSSGGSSSSHSRQQQQLEAAGNAFDDIERAVQSISAAVVGSGKGTAAAATQVVFETKLSALSTLRRIARSVVLAGDVLGSEVRKLYRLRGGGGGGLAGAMLVVARAMTPVERVRAGRSPEDNGATSLLAKLQELCDEAKGHGIFGELPEVVRLLRGDGDGGTTAEVSKVGKMGKVEKVEAAEREGKEGDEDEEEDDENTDYDLDCYDEDCDSMDDDPKLTGRQMGNAC